jgi:hypothetical protein
LQISMRSIRSNAVNAEIAVNAENGQQGAR